MDTAYCAFGLLRFGGDRGSGWGRGTAACHDALVLSAIAFLRNAAAALSHATRTVAGAVFCGGKPRRPTRGRGCTYCHSISLATPRRLLLRHGTSGYTSFRGCATASTERIAAYNGPPPQHPPKGVFGVGHFQGRRPWIMRAAALPRRAYAQPITSLHMSHSNIIFPLHPFIQLSPSASVLQPRFSSAYWFLSSSYVTGRS